MPLTGGAGGDGLTWAGSPLLFSSIASYLPNHVRNSFIPEPHRRMKHVVSYLGAGFIQVDLDYIVVTRSTVP
jgi:hypothetical protein